jgi:hypothetical protein
MGWIYEVRHCDGLRCHDTHIKFHKDRIKHSNVNGGGESSDTQTAWRSHKPTLGKQAKKKSKENGISIRMPTHSKFGVCVCAFLE